MSKIDLQIILRVVDEHCRSPSFFVLELKEVTNTRQAPRRRSDWLCLETAGECGELRWEDAPHAPRLAWG